MNNNKGGNTDGSRRPVSRVVLPEQTVGLSSVSPATAPSRGRRGTLLFASCLIAGLGFVAWKFKGPELARLAGRTTISTTAEGEVSGLQKCVQGEKILYTNGKCPQGTREAAVAGGALTVVPAVRIPAEKKPSAIPDLRQMLNPGEDASTREQMIEKATGN